jgi:hypothetical protein
MPHVVRVRLPSMDLVSFIDNNEGKYGAQKKTTDITLNTLFSQFCQAQSWIIF